MAKKASLSKKKNIKLPSGVLHVKTTFNNTIVTITDHKGNKVIGGGTGRLGFKGTKKSTPFAAEMLTRDLVREAKDQFGLKEVGIVAKGLGLGRDGVFKGINDVGGIDITYIREATGIQFGGTQGFRPTRN